MSPAGEAPRPAGAYPAALGGMTVLAVAMGIGRFVYTPILPAMQEALGLSGSAAGLIAAANFVGYLLGALLVALPGLPGRRRTWMFGALLASALTTGAMGLADGLAAFAILRFLSGVASALAFVFGAALVLDQLAARGRPGLSALYFAGPGIGIALSGILVPALETAGVGWHGLWFACGLASLAGLGVAALLIPSDEPGAARARAADRGDGRPLGPLILSYGLFGFGYVITATFLVAIARADPALRSFEPALWLSVGLASAPSVFLWRAAARRIGTLAAYALACGVEAVGVAASVLWPSWAGVLLAAVLLGGTFVPLTALGFDAARVRAGGAARPLALMTASFGVGQVIGPVVGGLMRDAFGSYRAPSLVAVAFLVTAGLIVLAEIRPA